VRAKETGGCAAAGRTRPRVRSGHCAGKGVTGGPHLSSAAGAEGAEQAGSGGVGRLGRAEVGPAAVPGCHADCWVAACWLAARLLRARNNAGLKGGRD
jgi:hypothetical protein